MALENPDHPKAKTSKAEAAPNRWRLRTKGSLRPPLVESVVEWSDLTGEGSQDGITLRRAVGRVSDGREVILTMLVKEQRMNE
jgi:hypothetical protein